MIAIPVETDIMIAILNLPKEIANNGIFKDQFNDLANRSSNYWQGLAEHTALRIREFGRLQGYKKAKARNPSFRT